MIRDLKCVIASLKKSEELNAIAGCHMISEIMRMGDLLIRPPISDSFDKFLAITKTSEEGQLVARCRLLSQVLRA